MGIPGAAGSHHLPRPNQSQQDMGMMGKSYSQYGAEPLMAGGLEELRGSNGHSVFNIQFIFFLCLNQLYMRAVK